MLSVFFLLLLLTAESTVSANSDLEDGDGKGLLSTKVFVREMIVRAQQRLGTGLYKVFARREPGNLILSPWSVMSLLTVTYLMAGGKTANEIAEQLRINLLRRKEIVSGYMNINEAFRNAENSSQTFDCINEAFVGRDLRVGRRLDMLLQKHINTHSQRGDSVGATPDNSTLTTHRWARRLLRKEIRGLTKNGLHGGVKKTKGRTSLWLLNLVHFQGQWQNPFSPQLTHQAKFLVNGSHPVSVPTMFSKARYPRSHYPDLGASALELPYGQDGRFSLFVLRPDRPDGLPKLEKRLRHFHLESILSDDHWIRQTKVFLPRFKFQTEVQLIDAMKKLGFRRMFSPRKSDFSRLESPSKANSKNFRNSPHVSKMVQRTMIDVSENGTTGASATAMQMTTRRYIQYFRVNHPFLFVLRDKLLKINIFIGRVTDPRDLS